MAQPFAMGEVVQYRPPRAHEEYTAYLGMIIFLGAWAMMFGALFFVYGGMRARAPLWPPPGTPILPLALPGVNTAAIFVSSVVLQLGIVWTRQGKQSRLGPALLGATILGAVFLVLQSIVWNTLFHEGLKPSSGSYGSVFYGLTWIHAAHVLVGLLALAWICFRAFRGAYTPARFLPVRLWALYWHFVGVVWVLMFVTVYVL